MHKGGGRVSMCHSHKANICIQRTQVRLTIGIIKKILTGFVFLHFAELCGQPEYFYFTNTSKLNFKIVRKVIVMQKEMEVRIG